MATLYFSDDLCMLHVTKKNLEKQRIKTKGKLFVFIVGVCCMVFLIHLNVPPYLGTLVHQCCTNVNIYKYERAEHKYLVMWQQLSVFMYLDMVKTAC